MNNQFERRTVIYGAAAMLAVALAGIAGGFFAGRGCDGPKPPPSPDDKTNVKALVRLAWEWEVDQDVGKIARLAGVYREAAKLADSKFIDTAGVFLSHIRRMREKAIGDGLPVIRRAVADYLNQHLPDDPDAPLDNGTDNRKLIQDHFNRAADALERVRSNAKKAA
jgi:hypothetical protein